MLRKHVVIGISAVALLLNSSFSSMAAQSKAPSNKAAGVQKFNGCQLYQEALADVLKYHKELVDPAKRATFQQEWEHKFDNSGMCDSEDKTDKAIAEMLKSLGQRFDYYLDRKSAAREEKRVHTARVGIGAKMATVVPKPAGDNSPLTPAQIAMFRSFIGSDKTEREVRLGNGVELMVMAVEEGSPAEGVLQPEDIVTAVAGQPVDGRTAVEVGETVHQLAGKPVQIDFLRVENGTPVKHTAYITPGSFRQRVVHVKHEADGITRIVLDNFLSETGDDEMSAALTEAAKGKGIILDLRNNPGGDLEQVVKMISHFLADGTAIVVQHRMGNGFDREIRTLTADGMIITTTRADQPGQVTIKRVPRAPLLVPVDMPVVILIDGGSASGSEMLSGALQFHHRATVKGHPSHGKGVGQAVIPLKDGRVLEVTWLEFLPAGVAIDWTGIIPDEEIDEGNGDVDQVVASAVRSIQEQSEANKRRKARAAEVQQQHRDDFARRNEAEAKVLGAVRRP